MVPRAAEGQCCFRPFAMPGWIWDATRSRDLCGRAGSSCCGRNGHPHQTADRPAAGSRQLVEQPLRFFQISGVEALGERAVEGCQQVARLAPPALLAPQPGEARGGAQFVAPCALLAGNCQGGAERVLGLRWIGLWQASGELAAQAMNFCVPAPLAGDAAFADASSRAARASSIFPASASASASRVRFNGVNKRVPVASAAAIPSRMRAIPVVGSPFWASAQPRSIRPEAAHAANPCSLASATQSLLQA